MRNATDTEATAGTAIATMPAPVTSAPAPITDFQLGSPVVEAGVRWAPACCWMADMAGTRSATRLRGLAAHVGRVLDQAVDDDHVEGDDRQRPERIRRDRQQRGDRADAPHEDA